MKHYFLILMIVCVSAQAMEISRHETLDLTQEDRPITCLKKAAPEKIKEIILMCNNLCYWPADLQRFYNLEVLAFANNHYFLDTD